MMAVLKHLTLQLAFVAAFGAGQLIVAVATSAPMPFASRGIQFHSAVTATAAPAGFGWG